MSLEVVLDDDSQDGVEGEVGLAEQRAQVRDPLRVHVDRRAFDRAWIHDGVLEMAGDSGCDVVVGLVLGQDGVHGLARAFSC